MKIMFVCVSLQGGGTERVIANLGNFFIKNNDIKIVKLLNIKDEYNTNKKIQKICIDKTKYSNLSSLKKFTKKFSIFRIIKIRGEIENYSPDIIICFLPLPSIYIMLLKKISKKIKNIPVVLSERGDPSKTFRNKFIYKLMTKLYKNADGFVFQTSDAMEYYKNIIACESKIIANPINPFFIKKDYSHNREKIIVTIGRIEKQKNHKLLIDSFKNIHNKHPDYKLLIYGEGSLKESLIKYVNEIGLKNYVIFKGISSKLYNDIYNARIFVLSSNFEGMPNALMEALALGIPCISTDCPVGGPKMLITNNKNGILVEVDNITDMTNAIEKIISNPKYSNELSKNAIESIKKYHPDAINKEWEIYIDKVAKKNYKKKRGAL